MNTEKLKQRLVDGGKSDLSMLHDAFDICFDTKDHATNRKIRRYALQHILNGGGKDAVVLYNKTLLFDAPVDFDCFMLALERNRPAKEQFWLPRREKLFPVCRALQDMEDDKLDELFLSLPPRVGKSTIVMMFVLWVMGRNSERSNLYCSFTDKAVDPFYAGLLEVLTDSVTYAYFDIFPTAKIASTNAKDDLLNLDRKKRYASFTGRPIGGTLNGACDCNGFIIGDDLCSGIEEAMSKDRLATLWTTVDNNLIPRAKQNAKRLWIGTRWSLLDPQGKRLDLLQNDPKYRSVRWKYINTPALNENDESNFEYKYGVGFSTEYYQQRRASFERNNDMASWYAQYQGEPIERDGAVFSADDLMFYNGELPENTTPDNIYIAVDPSWGGGDFTAAPVFFQFGDFLYLHDVVYSNAEKRITQPAIVHMAKKYGVQAIYVEATKMTSSYAEDIDKALRAEGIKINIKTTIAHYTGNGKEQRIWNKAAEIRERVVFRNDGCRSKEYNQFMQNLYSFTISGKNKHDDAPDSVVIGLTMPFSSVAKVELFKRFW